MSTHQPWMLVDAFAGVELLLRLDEIQLAREGIAALDQVAPDAARLHLFRGWLTLHDGNAVLAAKYFRLALGRDPLEPFAWHGLAAALPSSKDQFASARATRLASTEAVADLRRGKPYLARAPFELLRANHPDQPEWSLLLAECLRRMGEIAAARDTLAPELDRVPLSAPAALLGAALSDDPAVVAERLRDAARSDPAWLTARRLWAPDNPPLQLPTPPEVAMPSAVAERIADVRAVAQGQPSRARPAGPPLASHGKPRPPQPAAPAAPSRPQTQDAAQHAPQTESISSEVADVLQQVQHASQRIFGRSPQPLATGDVVALLVTHRGSLIRRYGRAVAGEIERRLGLLRTALAGRGIQGEILLVDQVGQSGIVQVPPVVDGTGEAGARAIAELLRAVRKQLDAHKQRLDAILLVGGDSVVPFHRLPNPSQDGDGAILSDNPYGCQGGSAHVPDVVVARLPDGGADGGALLLSLLQRSIDYHEGWLAPPDGSAGLALPLLRRLVGNTRPKAPINAWGASAAAWREPSEAIYREIGAGSPLVIFPPAGPGRLEPSDSAEWESGRILYFNLHGLPGGPNWYGQAAGAAPNDPLPLALTPAHVGELEPATICLSEACFGAEITGRSPNDAMVLRLLSRGALAFVGCTATAYGAVSLPLGGADVLAQQVFQYLRRGQPIGRALLLARDWMARETIENQGYLDPDDAKTLLSFVLLGDPWASAYAKPLLESKLALPALQPVIAQRQPVQINTLSLDTAHLAQKLLAKVAPSLAQATMIALAQDRVDRLAKGHSGTVVFSATTPFPTVDGQQTQLIARLTITRGTASKMILSR